MAERRARRSISAPDEPPGRSRVGNAVHQPSVRDHPTVAKQTRATANSTQALRGVPDSGQEGQPCDDERIDPLAASSRLPGTDARR